MNSWSPHHYRQEALAQGRDADTIRNALDQACKLQELGLPAILTLKHLAVLTDTPYVFLRRITERRLQDPYRSFQIRKRSGGFRVICVPISPLIRVQKWIAHHVLRNAETHPRSFAYGPGQSIIKCASVHCRCQWLIKIDIQQFFESISERQIFHVYRKLGYQHLVSFELARLCTRLTGNSPDRYHKNRWRNNSNDNERVIKQYDSQLVGHLPQGAPTSPMLSNLVSYELDEQLSRIASQHDLAYTRYADDLIFSHSGPFNRQRGETVVQQVYEALIPLGLRPRTAKTVIAPPGARKIVLGLLVDRDRPRLQKSFRSMLEQHIYCIVRNGPAVHAQRRGFRSVFSLQQYVGGLLSYAEQVDPDFAVPLKRQFASVNWIF